MCPAASAEGARMDRARLARHSGVDTSAPCTPGVVGPSVEYVRTWQACV